MARWRRRLIGGGLALALLAAAGCASLMHEMQPWRLRRLNQTPSRSSDAFYSVPDGATRSDENGPDATRK